MLRNSFLNAIYTPFHFDTTSIRESLSRWALFFLLLLARVYMRGDYKLSQQRGKYVYPPVDERRNWSFSQLIWISEIAKRNKRRRKISLSSLWSATNFYTPHRVFVTVVATRLPPQCGNYAKLSSHHQHMHAPHTTESWADHHEIKKFIIHKTSFFLPIFFLCFTSSNVCSSFLLCHFFLSFRWQTLTLLFMEFLSVNSFTDPGVFDGITRTRESFSSPYEKDTFFILWPVESVTGSRTTPRSMDDTKKSPN